MSDYKEILTKKITETIKQNESSAVKKTLFIPMGVDLSTVYPENNFFSFNTDLSLLDVVEYTKTRIHQDIVNNYSNNKSWMWLSYEVYSQCREIIDGFFEVKFLKNNLYYNFYPLNQNLDLAELAYEKDGEELEDEQQNQLDLFYKFYGSVLRTDAERYFVSYQVEPLDDQLIEIFAPQPNLGLLEDISDSAKHVELESEIDFLDLTADILEGESFDHIQLLTETQNLNNIPDKLLERVEILLDLLPTKNSLGIVIVRPEQKPIQHSEEYHRILSEYWGYPSFRDLEIYKDVQKSKEIINVSQEAIIDSIVSQAEQALKGDSYRDVFVTSPTGAGKSIMFQIPAIYMAENYTDEKPLTLVISPLISLMQDQVAGMQKKQYNKAATINSNLSIIDKNRIVNQIKNGEIDILYLSTETLQNRSNISDLIGDRKIGLFIVDEAHIVTTWGKSFRADYWYMGIYLQKLRQKYNFPIVTFTATAIYAGVENMYAEIRTSLNMVRPITYFGKVKRNDIYMEVFDESHEDLKGKDYLTTKYNLVLSRLKLFSKNNMKTLVYFPTVKTLLAVHSFLKQDPEIYDQTSVYYGPLNKELKEEAYQDFRSGKKPFMLATKAFGMGIDISDIQNVYHYAPTGDLLDYIQEIGRVARDERLNGYAWVDYFKNDLFEIQRMHGMSAIRKYQILAVMEKIREIYRTKKTRNLIMNADDFRYLLQNANAEDDSSIDNRLKIILLMIEKDFEQKYGYSAFYARPRQYFGKELVFGNEEQRKLWKEYGYDGYLSRVDSLINYDKYDSVYAFNLVAFWEDRYKNISYPQFKYFVFTSASLDNKLSQSDREFFGRLNFCSGLKYKLTVSASQALADFKKNLKVLDDFLMQCQIGRRYFDRKMLASFLQKKLKIDSSKASRLSDSIINNLLQYQDSKQIRAIMEKPRGKQMMYSVLLNYDQLLDGLENVARNLLIKCFNKGTVDEENVVLYRWRIFANSKTRGANTEVIVLGLMESFGLCSYEVISSDSPEIYIRVNSMYPIERALENPDQYQNQLLSDVAKKYYISVGMFKYLFTMPKHGNNEMEIVTNYTNEFWDIVEDYFFGKFPAAVEKEIYQPRRRSN